MSQNEKMAMPSPYRKMLDRAIAFNHRQSGNSVQGNAVSLQDFLGRDTTLPWTLYQKEYNRN